MIKEIIIKTIHRVELLYANSSYERKRQYLIKNGAIIGNKTRLNCHVDAFGTEPFLITVGDDCLFASGVNLITHDGAIKVLNAMGKFDGQRMDNIAPIVIIGANSIVTQDIQDNSVVVGCPAKKIRTVDEYYDKVICSGRLYPTAGLSIKQKRAYFEKSKKMGDKNEN